MGIDTCPAPMMATITQIAVYILSPPHIRCHSCVCFARQAKRATGEGRQIVTDAVNYFADRGRSQLCADLQRNGGVAFLSFDPAQVYLCVPVTMGVDIASADWDLALSDLIGCAEGRTIHAVDFCSTDD
ncbi:hypothetical protein TNCV_3626671 [Trichonephila clavipes]|nr:hypothetical protein TNCV_3626671 [Trichonephila clavipes]